MHTGFVRMQAAALAEEARAAFRSSGLGGQTDSPDLLAVMDMWERVNQAQEQVCAGIPSASLCSSRSSLRLK